MPLDLLDKGLLKKHFEDWNFHARDVILDWNALKKSVENISF